MTVTSGIALFFAMLLSALIPGPSVMAVVSRAMTSGTRHGLMVTLGIVFADYIFIALALTGLSAVSSLLGELAAVLKYLGGGYLIWLAYRTWTSEVVLSEVVESGKASLIGNLVTGLMIGLSNPKAILFYMGFFPAFIELSTIGPYEVLTILGISTFAVGGVLSLYACAGAKARDLFQGYQARRLLNRISGTVLASCGAMLAVRG